MFFTSFTKNQCISVSASGEIQIFMTSLSDVLFLLSSLAFVAGVSSALMIVAAVIMPSVITFFGQCMNGKMGGWSTDRGQSLFLLLRKAQGL